MKFLGYLFILLGVIMVTTGIVAGYAYIFGSFSVSEGEGTMLVVLSWLGCFPIIGGAALVDDA